MCQHQMVREVALAMHGFLARHHSHHGWFRPCRVDEGNSTRPEVLSSVCCKPFLSQARIPLSSVRIWDLRRSVSALALDHWRCCDGRCSATMCGALEGLDLCIVTWTVLVCTWGPGGCSLMISVQACVMRRRRLCPRGNALRGPDGMKSFHETIALLKEEQMPLPHHQAARDTCFCNSMQKRRTRAGPSTMRSSSALWHTLDPHAAFCGSTRQTLYPTPSAPVH